MLDCGLLVNTFAVTLILGFALAVFLLSCGCQKNGTLPYNSYCRDRQKSARLTDGHGSSKILSALLTSAIQVTEKILFSIKNRYIIFFLWRLMYLFRCIQTCYCVDMVFVTSTSRCTSVIALWFSCQLNDLLQTRIV